MNDVSEEELGPIDYVVVEFPAGTSNFTGAMAVELAALSEAELIRVLDLMILTKDQDGNIEVLEVEDLDGTGELGSIEADLAEILAFEDVENLAAAMEPGSTAGVLVWENTWAAPFAVAARQSGGQLIASGRIPTQALIASFENDDNEGAE
jgi:hypothetical protein